MGKRKLKPIVKIFIFLVVLGALGFCTNKFDLIDKVKSFINKDNKVTWEVKPEPKLQIFDEDSDSRVIAVSINNLRAAWPHSGLQEAYLVYELIAEGGITRLLAFYKDTDTAKIGSVRSARHYFLDYVLENDAVFAHFGNSPTAGTDLINLSINNIDGMKDGKAFYRDTALLKVRAYEHTAFTTMERLKSAIEYNGYRSTSDKDMLLNYSIKENDLSKKEYAIKADNVSINYSSYQTTSYEYDPDNKNYKLFMAGQPHVDAESTLQYTVKNIITYEVLNIALDNAGRQDLKNIGSGEGYLISNGYAVPITWEKSSRESQTVYKYKYSDEEIKVNDGNTWIHIRPKGKALSITANPEETSSSEES